MFVSRCPAQGELQLLRQEKRETGTQWLQRPQWRLENSDNEKVRKSKIRNQVKNPAFKKWMRLNAALLAYLCEHVCCSD